MEIPYPDQGIVLTSDKYRESDRLLVIYTREHGKIKVISRGSRKMSSKLSPHLEPLDYVSLMLVNGKVFINLTGSSKIEDFKNLKASGAYTLLALYLLELVKESVPENLPDDNIYNLLLELLRYLDSNGGKIKKAAQNYYPVSSSRNSGSAIAEFLDPENRPPAARQVQDEKKDRFEIIQIIPKPKLTIYEIIIAFKLKLLEFLGLRPEEIGEMPEVLKIIETNFDHLESIDWKKISKSPLPVSANASASIPASTGANPGRRTSETGRLEKVLDHAFFDVVGHSIVGFEKYIR